MKYPSTEVLQEWCERVGVLCGLQETGFGVNSFWKWILLSVKQGAVHAAYERQYNSLVGNYPEAAEDITLIRTALLEIRQPEKK
jgi:hypothetical protein